MNTFIPTKKTKNAEDNMIPMINIVFLLLIFFMIAGQITAVQNQDIVLPKAESGVPIIEKKVTLQLTDTNQIFFNGRGVLLDELGRELDALGTDETRVSLQADRRVKAVDLDKVLTILRARKIAKVTLYAEQKGRE
jgi:biopolymer transport protein ExbD